MENILSEFNKTLDEFMVKMINQLVSEPKLKTYYSSFKVARMMNVKLPIQIFMGGCINFVDQIKSRDSEFFLKRETFIDSCVQCSSFSNDIGLIDHWYKLSDKSKTAIWDYIQTLYVMGEMYVNNDDKALASIDNVYSNLTYDEMQRFSDDKVDKFSDSFVSKIQ